MATYSFLAGRFVESSSSTLEEKVSLSWAWGSRQCFMDKIRGCEIKFEGGALLNLKPRAFRRYSVFVFAIVLYQIFFRSGKALGTGECPMVPNCSNFAIGCFSRLPFWQAWRLSRKRINNCDGSVVVRFE